MEQRLSASPRSPCTVTSPRHMGQVFKSMVQDTSFSQSLRGGQRKRRVGAQSPRPPSYALRVLPIVSRDARHPCWLHERLALIGQFHNTELVLRLCYRRVTPSLRDLICRPPDSAALGRTPRLGVTDAVLRPPAFACGLQIRSIGDRRGTIQSCAACLFPDCDTTITGASRRPHSGDRGTRRKDGEGGDGGQWQRSETRLMPSLSPK
jgi:hypothetical protein